MPKINYEEYEVWKDVVDYEGIYQVSSKGRIRSLDREVDRGENGALKIEGMILSPADNKGYKYFNASKQGKKAKVTWVHRLVAETFIPNPERKPCVNHIDGDKNNNAVDNLEWCTHEENQNHAVENGLDGKAVVILLKDKETGVIHELASMARASKFMGYGHAYVSGLLKKGINETDKYYIKKARKQK